MSLPLGGSALALAVLFGCLLARPAHSQEAGEAQLVEYRVKAAMLLNFAKFVEWTLDPPAPDAPIVIASLDGELFADILADVVKGKTIDGHPVIARHFAKAADLSEVQPCHILFISAGEEQAGEEALKRLDGSGIVTVADFAGFLERGGMIELMIVDKKLRFAVNEAAATRAGIKFSSQLLKLATNLGEVK